jgi:hypothetical protein
MSIVSITVAMTSSVVMFGSEAQQALLAHDRATWESELLEYAKSQDCKCVIVVGDIAWGISRAWTNGAQLTVPERVPTTFLVDRRVMLVAVSNLVAAKGEDMADGLAGLRNAHTSPDRMHEWSLRDMNLGQVMRTLTANAGDKISVVGDNRCTVSLYSVGLVPDSTVWDVVEALARLGGASASTGANLVVDLSQGHSWLTMNSSVQNHLTGGLSWSFSWVREGPLGSPYRPVRGITWSTGDVVTDTDDPSSMTGKAPREIGVLSPERKDGRRKGTE